MKDKFDVFLCHNSEDKPAVKEIGNRLKEQGLWPWLDEWDLRPGIPWQPELEKIIEKTDAAAVFVGESGIGPWQQVEVQAYLRELVNRKCPVIPVIIKGAPDLPQLPLFLNGLTWVDFRQNEPDPLKRLIWGITGKKPVPELTLSTSSQPPDHQQNDSSTVVKDSEFTKNLRKQVSELLDGPTLTPLKQALQKNAGIPGNNQNMNAAGILIPVDQAFDFEISMDKLQNAAEICLKELKDKGSSETLDVEEFKQAITNLLGRLVLLTVDENWLPEKEILSQQPQPAHFEIPVETSAGLEVVVSRLREHPAALQLHSDGVTIYGARSVAAHELEFGLDLESQEKQIKKLLWNKVFPHSFDAANNDSDLTKEHEKQLMATLKLRQRRGETYYFTIASDELSHQSNHTLLQSLTSNGLMVLIRTEQSESVFIIQEYDLVANVSEFLNMLQR